MNGKPPGSPGNTPQDVREYLRKLLEGPLRPILRHLDADLQSLWPEAVHRARATVEAYRQQRKGNSAHAESFR